MTRLTVLAGNCHQYLTGCHPGRRTGGGNPSGNISIGVLGIIVFIAAFYIFFHERGGKK